MADENDTCKNPVCGCAPQPGGKYCSASCEAPAIRLKLIAIVVTRNVVETSNRLTALH